MEKEKNRDSKFINIIKIILLTISLLFFLFSLISLFVQERGNIFKISKNFSSIFPWLFLIILSYLSYKREVMAGILLILYSLFLSAILLLSSINTIILTIRIIPIFLIGIILVIYGLINK